MIKSNDMNSYYYANQPNNQRITLNSKSITTKVYVNRLTVLQVFSTCIIIIALGIQAIAIGITEWFVLNVNEYIPTSKGGLWSYCYIANVGSIGQYSCLRYEDLPNFAVFVNSRLYDSRILLLCSAGFCFLILVIEIFGVLCLCFAESKGDLIDSIVARNSTVLKNSQVVRTNEIIYPSSPILKNKAKNDEMNNSARFTTSIIVNTSPQNSDIYRTLKPTGYYAYLGIALITLIGSVMEFVLKVSGFSLFDAYINKLLTLNTVFLAYKSWSYWMMIVSMVLVVFFWLFKVFTTRYVISMTKKLMESRETIPSVYTDSAQSDEPYDQYRANYTTVSRVPDDNKSVMYTNPSYENYPAESKFVYDFDSNEDDLSSSAFSSRQQSTNSNFYHEYLQVETNQYSKADNRSIGSKSIMSIVRF